MDEQHTTFELNLLLEEAVDKDSFEGGIHENVADQLLKIVNANKTGLTIGLEGAWGGLENPRLLMFFVKNWISQEHSSLISMLGLMKVIL